MCRQFQQADVDVLVEKARQALRLMD